MALYDNIPSPEELACLVTLIRADQEKARMDWLSDPRHDFRYSIAKNGECKVSYPFAKQFKSLRDAIDWFIEHPEKQIHRIP